jgi:hypothetical protein
MFPVCSVTYLPGLYPPRSNVRCTRRAADEEARYLVERLEQAVAKADTAVTTRAPAG